MTLVRPGRSRWHPRAEACPDLRALAFTNTSSHTVDFGRVAAIDNLSTLTALALVRVRAHTSFSALLMKSATSTTGWRWTTDSAGTGMHFRFYRTSNTSYATHTTTGRVSPLGAWRWLAVTADVSAGTGLKVAFFASPLDGLLQSVPLGTLTEGSGAQTADSANNLLTGNGSTANCGTLDLALLSLWTGRLTLSDLHHVQEDPTATMRLRQACLGFWRPGHHGQSSVPDEGPLHLNGTITGAVATSGGVTHFWPGTSLGGGRAPSATTYTQVVGGGLTPAGALARQTAKPLAGGATPTGSLTRLTTKPLAGGLTPSGALTTLKVVILALGGGLTPAGALVRLTTKRLAGAATPAGDLLKRTTKLLTAGVTPSGVLASLKVVILALGGGLTPSGGLVRQTTKALAGAATPAGALSKRVTKLLSGAATPAGTFTKRVTKLLGGVLAPLGALVTQVTTGGATLMRLVAGVAITPFAAAAVALRPALESGARLLARRLQGGTDVGPEA